MEIERFGLNKARVKLVAAAAGALVLSAVVIGACALIVRAAPDPWLPVTQVFVIAAAYVVILLLIMTHQRRRRDEKALLKLLGDTTAEELLARLKELLDEQRTLSNDISDTIEKKIVEMRRIVKQADRMREKVAPQPTEQTPPSEPAARAVPAVEPTSRPELENLLGTLKPSVPLGPTLRELTAEDKRRRVYACADAGMSVNQIARETHIGKGEVKLILSLRRGR